MINIENLTFGYGEREVLKGINFKAEEGQLVAVLGPNGVGKSTMFKLMLGILKNYKGTIELCGRNIKEMSAREMANCAAYIPQTSIPVFNYTVMDTVIMGTTSALSPLNRPKEEQYEAAEKALDILGIGYLKSRGIARISGGERQLALIARAMVQNAKILVMDEPTANLDYGNQYKVMTRIKTLTNEGFTVLVSTHNPEQALRFSSHILALQDGQVLAAGPSDEVLTPELLEKIYKIPIMINEVELPTGKVRNCLPM